MNQNNEKAKIKDLEERIKRQKEAIENKDRIIKSKENKTNIYYGIRFVEVICIGIAVFGFLWNTTEVLNLTTPQFMMLYGGSGAVISEIISRVFKKKITELTKDM